MDLQQEVRSASGRPLRVVATPTGTPLRAEYTPATTVVGNLLWLVYLGAREVFGTRWKVGVLQIGHGRLRLDRPVHRQVLPRGTAPDLAMQELVRACESGVFD